MLRYILYDSFICMLIMDIGLVVQYIIVSVSCPKAYTLDNFNEFFIIAIFVILQLIDTQHKEYSMRLSFWMHHRTEPNYKTSLSMGGGELEGNFHTESELLIQSCNKIKKTVKDACTVIIFKDVKDSLKLVQVEIEQIKQRIGKAGYLKDIKFEQKENIDPDDKEFISQNFIDISYVTPEMSNRHSELTFFEFKEKAENFPFSHYGIDKLESVLSQIGKN